MRRMILDKSVESGVIDSVLGRRINGGDPIKFNWKCS